MTDRIEALERLARLREQQILSECEFEAEKARLMEMPLVSLSNEPELTALAAPTWRPRWLFLLGVAGLIAAIGGGVYLTTNAASVSDVQTPNGESAEQSVSASTAGSNAPRISALLKFDNAAECAPAEGLKLLLDEMRSLEPGADQATLSLSDGGASVRPQVRRIEVGAGAGSVISELHVSGSWDGLRVNGIRTVRFPSSENYSIQIRFQEGAEKVRRVLNAQGFDLPKVSELRNSELESDAELALGVEPIEGGSALVCARSSI